MNESMTIMFWGVRGSYPMPGASTARIGGNTPCIQMTAGKHLIILDAGTGLIGLGRSLMTRRTDDSADIVATLLFSHTHHDHTQGFPFFNPIYSPSTTLYVFGPKTLQDDLEQVLSRAMLPPVFPVNFELLPSVRVVRNLSEGESILLTNSHSEPRVMAVHGVSQVSLDDVLIRAMRSPAHPQGVFIYRIEHGGNSVVYATDTEGYSSGDQRLINFVRGATLLIHDSQYLESEYANPMLPKQGWGHSTWQMAVGVAQAARVQKLVLFHHEPEHSDDVLEQVEKEAQAVFPNTVLAREGMKIQL